MSNKYPVKVIRLDQHEGKVLVTDSGNTEASACYPHNLKLVLCSYSNWNNMVVIDTKGLNDLINKLQKIKRQYVKTNKNN